MIIIGLAAKFSRARQCGSRRSSGISTELHSRSTYSTVNTITEKVLKASNSGPVAGIEGGNRLGGEGEAVGDDENDEEDVDDAADRDCRRRPLRCREP